MKKIINGKVYDTDTATEKASWSNEGSWRDFRHCEETLYVKKTGEFFLYGEGGPMTQYAVSTGQNSWAGGKKILPLTYDSAKAWAEEKLSGDEYEAIFGAVVEDESKEVVTVKLSRTTIEKLRREMQQTGKGIGELIDAKLA